MQLVIDLPPRNEQIDFNRRRWEELCADPELARLPGRIETNAHGQILMSPPPAGKHSDRQGEIAFQLRQRMGGRALPECPISTIDGVRAADVGWYSDGRFAQVKDQIAFEIAPEICVEVLSPSNSEAEMLQKRRLYFEAGASEVWLCAVDGALRFFVRSEDPQTRSSLCPEFPQKI